MNKILEYQKLDGELINIDKSINKSNASKIVDQANSNANTAKSEMKELDKKAGELMDAYNKLQEIMNNNIQNIQRLEKQKVEVQDKEQLCKLYDNIKKVNNNLNIIEQRLNDINKNIDAVLKKFQKVKDSVAVSKDKKLKAQDEVDKLKTSFEGQKVKIKEEMDKLAKDIPSKTLELYEKVRKENIYPVFVSVIDDKEGMRCGKCKSVLPVARIGKLKNDGLVECEECRRIICTNLEDK